MAVAAVGMFPTTRTAATRGDASPGPFHQTLSDGTRGDRKRDSLLRTGSASASLPRDCASRICRGRKSFSSLQPLLPQHAPAPPNKQPYLHLVFQVLGSGHQGLDLAEREGGKFLQSCANGDMPLSHGWHSPLRGAAPVASPRAPLQREEGHAIRSIAGTGCIPCPRSTHHGHNSPARRSSSSPRLCW